jgi:hypothetical protein
MDRWERAIGTLGAPLTADRVDQAAAHLAQGGMAWVGGGAGVTMEWLCNVQGDNGTAYAPNLSRLLTEAAGRAQQEASQRSQAAQHKNGVAQREAEKRQAEDDQKWRDLDEAVRLELAGKWSAPAGLAVPTPRAAVAQMGPAQVLAAAERLGLPALCQVAEQAVKGGGADG